ncbi:MAG: septal ring lytic transglycosylase RlpA family protein [Acidobacteriia bacterium]|nr:septal ring lytic transglycosylase RlpA family protein [Terriglobia bacterium]
MRRVLSNILVVVVLITGLEAASRNNTHPIEYVQSNTASRLRPNPQKPYQVGTASWYGRYFHGKATASGEPFNMYQFTAAHRHLPLGTMVQVTNLRNGETVVVRVNDRGPMPKSRIIDLSYGAARTIGLSGHGVEPVRLDILEPAPEIAQNEAFLP